MDIHYCQECCILWNLPNPGACHLRYLEGPQGSKHTQCTLCIVRAKVLQWLDESWIFRRIKVFNMPVHHGVKTFVWGRKASMIDYVRNSSRCSVSWWRGECQKAEWLLFCIICIFPSGKFKQMVSSNKKISVKVWFINYPNSHLKDWFW